MAKLGIETLDPNAIASILGSVPERGAYKAELKSFVDSGEAGVQVSLTEGRFQGRKPQSVKTGFETAKGAEGAPEGSENVRVIVHEDQVYLIRTDMAPDTE
jgi:hypothetical protein